MAKNGRDPAKEVYWREVFQRQAASGLSIREFCQREKLTESAFFSWRRTIGQRDGAGSSSPAFLPAVVNSGGEHKSPLVLKLTSGLELRLPPAIPAARLAELVHALEARAEP